MPVPLTGAAALRSDVSWEPAQWPPTFLRAIEGETANALDLLFAMERNWFDAQAVDLLAAAPVLAATMLAAILGIAVKNAIRILDALVAAEIAIEVTHRAKRRLFGLKGLVPLPQVVRAPYRPDPNRGRGRPRHDIEEELPDAPSLPPRPLTPIECRSFDYAALEEAMAPLDAVVRRTRHALARRGPDMSPASEPRSIDQPAADILVEEGDTNLTQRQYHIYLECHAKRR